jgi:hypothetical protein
METVELELNWDSIGLYTAEDVRDEAKLLYDEWVCKRKHTPEDVAKMVLLQSRKRRCAC